MMMTLVKTKKSPYYQAKIRLVRGGPILYRSTGERNRVLAVKRLHELVEEFRVKPGLGIPGGQPTIASFCRLPLEGTAGGEYWTYMMANRATTTCARTRDILRTQILPTFGARTFDEVTPRFIEQWKQRRLTQVEKATAKKELDVLSNVFRIARKVYQYCRFNPVEDIERPTVPRKRTRTIPIADLQRFFAVTAQQFPEYLPPLLTLYLTGARIDEVRHLQPEDVVLKERKLLYRVKPQWSPKDAQDREIPLVEPLLSVLTRVLARHPGGPWLFLRPDRKTLACKRCGTRVQHLGNMRKTIRRIATIAEVSQRVTHHLFRHCHNTHGQQLGVRQEVAMELLGQQTTQVNRMYRDVSWQELVGAAQRLGTLMETSVVGNVVGVPESQKSSDRTPR
jgi:integrase